MRSTIPAVVLLLAGLSGGCTGTPFGDDPNVVIVLVDTLRADRLGLYGYAKDTSPNIDSLAEESVVFERAHSPAPWTLPSVTSLMLSKPLCEHAVLADGQRVEETAHTLAERLGQIGYSTGAFYKNPYAGKLSGLDQGFEVSQLVEEQIGSQHVATWLESHPDQPFFLYLHTTAPHNPAGAKPRHLEALGHSVPRQTLVELKDLVNRYRSLTRVDFAHDRPLGTTDNTAEQQQIMDRLSEMREAIGQLYDAQVRADDERVGSIIAELRDRGVWDDTLFVLLADHGEEMGEHGGWQHDQSVYEELIRVPLIMKLPRSLYGGERVSVSVSLLDVLPTIMEVVGHPELTEGARGKSLLPWLGDDLGPESGGRVTSLRNNRKKYFRPFYEARGDVNVAVVEGRWKGIYNVDLGSIELYDLASDPHETRDVSSSEPDRARAMLRAAHTYYQECVSRQMVTRTSDEMDPDQEEALRSLGYIQ